MKLLFLASNKFPRTLIYLSILVERRWNYLFKTLDALLKQDLSSLWVLCFGVSRLLIRHIPVAFNYSISKLVSQVEETALNAKYVLFRNILDLYASPLSLLSLEAAGPREMDPIFVITQTLKETQFKV